MQKYEIVAICVPGILQKKYVICVQERVLEGHHSLDTHRLLGHLRTVLIKDHALSAVIVVLNLLLGGMLFFGSPALAHLGALQAVIRIKENNIRTGGGKQGRLVPV